MTFFIPDNYDLPPTLFSILNSIVNYGNENPVKIRELAKNARTSIFDFEYPLDESVDKEEFETNILNHFIMRRIGFDTMTTFKIYLENKLNEIMPYYNKMFKFYSQWDLFENGETVTTTVTETKEGSQESNSSAETSSENTINTTDDNRFADMPENTISNVQNGNFLSTYTYNKNDVMNDSSSNSTGTQKVSSDDSLSRNENIKRSPGDKMSLYLQAQNEMNKLYTMLYKDLDSLFYQII